MNLDTKMDCGHFGSRFQHDWFLFKKFMICRITFTPVGFLNLTDTGALEHGDGWNHSRPGYCRFKGPLFQSQHGRGTDGVEYELYKFANEYTEIVWGD